MARSGTGPLESVSGQITGLAAGPAPNARRPLSRRVGAHILEEIRHVLPATIYFFLGFNLVLLTKQLMLEQYLIQFSGFFIATGAALIVGKVVLVVDKMPFLRRYDHAPADPADPVQDDRLYLLRLRGAADRGLDPLSHR